MTLHYLALALALGVSAQAQTTTPSQELPDAPSTTSQVKPPLVPTGPTAVIDTTMGRLTCKLFDKEAPTTVANFIGLAEGTKDWTDPKTLKKMRHEPFYTGTTFHRVIPGFMIQGGDRAGDGTGDPGYYFQDEIDPSLPILRHRRRRTRAQRKAHHLRPMRCPLCSARSFHRARRTRLKRQANHPRRHRARHHRPRRPAHTPLACRPARTTGLSGRSTNRSLGTTKIILPVSAIQTEPLLNPFNPLHSNARRNLTCPPSPAPTPHSRPQKER
jgi:hypothetical protein